MKNKILLLLGLAVTFSLFPNVNFGQAPDLGSASNFVFFSTTGAVSNAGISHITGNAGANTGDPCRCVVPAWSCGDREACGECSGIPHLAKNERDAPNFLYAALDTTACAPFIKERRIKFGGTH